MSAALDVVCAEAEEAVRSKDYNIVILSDRAAGPDRIPIPSLLATSAVHHHLIKQGLRTSVGLVVETGEAHEVHQFAVLAGYGAEAINPYLAFDTLEQILPDLDEMLTLKEAQKRYIKAIDKGLLKVMSKMGISTYQSYCGAQIFDAVGLKSSFLKRYFTGTHMQVEAGLRQSPAKRRNVIVGIWRRAGAGRCTRCRGGVRLSPARRSPHVAAKRRRRFAARRARQSARQVSLPR
jgi:glutamate synthase (NADPH/NADH) large chain